MILTEAEVKRLVRAKGFTTPAIFDDAVQEALIAVCRAEEEKPGDKEHAISRAITAARNYARMEHIYHRHFGGGDFNQGISIHSEETENLLVASRNDKFSTEQIQALRRLIAIQDRDTREILTRFLAGEDMLQISRKTYISHSRVSRVIRRFRIAAAKQIQEE